MKWLCACLMCWPHRCGVRVCHLAFIVVLQCIFFISYMSLLHLSCIFQASEKEVIWVMRISMVLVGAAATVIALLVNSIYTLFALCSDLVYVILFPQLCSVIHIPDANIYGSIMGYIMGLILRVGGGESAIGFPALIKYPYYDEENKKQLFPFKTLSMIVSFLTIISVSYLTKYLFTKGILSEKYDFLHYFKQYEVDKTDAKENENYDMDRQEKYESKF